MPTREPDTNRTRVRARARRNMVLLVWWAITILGLFALSIGGPWVLVIPVGVIGILVASNTIAVVRQTGPEHSALEPGRLQRADRENDPVAVAASRAPRRGANDKARRQGTLSYGRGRLTFVVHGQQGRADRSGPPDQTGDQLILDAVPAELVLGMRPTWLRPTLDISDNDVHHVIDFSLPSDLGSGGVGSVVAAAWFDQLVERGAKIAPR
jgi:hypothetical protein